MLIKFLLKKELQLNSGGIAVYCIILSLLFAAVLSLWSLSLFLPDEFLYQYVDNGDVISVGVNTTSLNELQSLRNSNTNIEVTKDGLTYNITLTSASKSLYIEDYMAGKCYLFENHYGNNFEELITQNKFTGDLWDETSNNNNSIWLSSYAAEELNAAYGDIIDYKGYQLRVAGIYIDDNYCLPYFILPFCFVTDLTDCSITADIQVDNNIALYYFKVNANAELLEDTYGYYAIFSALIIIEAVMLLLSILLLFAVFVLICDLFSLLIDGKRKTFALLSGLGTAHNTLCRFIFCIIEFVITVTAIIGTLISVGVNYFISECFNTILYTDISINLYWYLPVIGFALLNFVSASLPFILKKQLNKMSLKSVLAQEF